MEIKRTANAGVLLTLDGVRILLDGVCQPLPPYLGTFPGEREQLLQNVPDAVAFTHIHPDHCDVSFVSEYQEKTAGPVMGPADIPFSGSSVQQAANVRITPIPSRHLGRNDVAHYSYIVEGSRCVWYVGDAAPGQWREREDLPQPDVLIAPFAYAIGGGWDITCQLAPKAFVLVHMPDPSYDPEALWQQVEATVSKKAGPGVYVPELGQKIHFAE